MRSSAAGVAVILAAFVTASATSGEILYDVDPSSCSWTRHLRCPLQENLRWGAAFPPTSAKCQVAVEGEVERALRLIETSTTYFSRATDAGTTRLTVTVDNGTREFNGADALAELPSTIVLNPCRCFYTTECKACFDHDFATMRKVRKAFSLISVVLLFVAAYWYLVVSSSSPEGQQISHRSWGELAQAIWRRNKELEAQEAELKKIDARIDNISKQRAVFKREHEQRRSSIKAGNAAADEHKSEDHEENDEHDEEDDEVIKSALEVLQQSFGGKIEDLDDRLADEEAQRLESKLQCVKLEGTISVLEKKKNSILKSYRRAGFVYSVTTGWLIWHLYYTQLLCPNKNPSQFPCASLDRVIATHAAKLIGESPPAESLVPLPNLLSELASTTTGRLTNWARRELGAEGVRVCLAPYTASSTQQMFYSPNSYLLDCIAKSRAAKAPELVRSFFESECRGLLKGWGWRLSYVQALQKVLSRLVLHASITATYTQADKHIEQSFCTAWEQVLQAASTGDASALKSIDFSSVSKQRKALRNQHHVEALVLSFIHRALGAAILYPDTNSDFIDDADLDDDGVPDEVQTAIEALVLNT